MMASSSRIASSGPVISATRTFRRPTSTSGKFYSSTSSTSFASSTFSHSPSSSVDRPISPSRPLVRLPQPKPISAPPTSTHRRTCLCSPTNHPGSFRCSLHKTQTGSSNAASSSSNQLNARRSAMKNSLVRIGTVEGGDWVKRALTALIRPSSHQQKRRAAFQLRPSRLSIMSTAEECRS